MRATHSAASSAVPTKGKKTPSAPRSRASLTQASSRFGTRTSGAQGVPAVAAIMACRLSGPAAPCSWSMTTQSAPAAAIAWTETAEGIVAT